ncbi:MAG: signal recognition particle-docking protein FtsY [Opitutales bacterium]|nr:signal recognition particle-docking protein FtsY [Opitutales bacterium]
MSRLFSFFRSGFSKTTEKVASVFSRRKLDDDTISLMEETLYGADFGLETTDEVMDAIKKSYRSDKEMRDKDPAALGVSVLMNRLQGAEGRLPEAESKPQVICLIGVNGSGKTTTAAKLGKWLTDQGKTVLIGACDTFRAAANEQLKTWCQRLDLPLIASQQGADAASVAFDAYQAAARRGADYLILDTAGRLHTKSHLMDELTKIRRVLQKLNPQAPEHSWLVVDGSIGTNSILQARTFNESFGLTGLILTKLDGTSKGGAIVAIYRELGIPVYFVGLGEKPEDLRLFDSEDYAHAIFGLKE